MEVKVNKINIEQFFGIVPIDETLVENDSSILELITEQNEQINNADTRKSDDYYQNLREKEGEPTKSGPYSYSGGSGNQNLIGNETQSESNDNNITGSYVQSINGQTGAVAIPIPPTGCGMEWYSDTPPDGWLIQNGQAISRIIYANLFAILGTKFGVGDGVNTFNLPNRTKRVPVGAGDGLEIGNTGGSWNHTHSVPAHYHGMGTGANLAISSSGGHTTSLNHDHSSFTTATGGTHTHTITDPQHAHGQQVSANSGGSGIRMDFDGDVPGLQAYPQGINTQNAATGITINTTNSGHTHDIDVPAFSGNSSSDGTHTHPSNSITGAIGLVTGGVNGNAAMTSGENNQAYIVVMWIIKT